MTKEDQKHISVIAAQMIVGLLAPALVKRKVNRLTGRNYTYADAYRAIGVVSWFAYFASRSIRSGWESVGKMNEATEALNKSIERKGVKKQSASSVKISPEVQKFVDELFGKGPVRPKPSASDQS